ncbi:MAG: hypothetical protein OEW58_10395 [Gammaproteobacteria bacterium]|nr:hypothetical protein [Gammaproteobacteria bacterium]
MRFETYVVHGLDPVRRDRLVDRFYALFQKIFEGVSKEKVKKSVFETAAEDIRIRFFQDEMRNDIGFCVLYRYQINFAGKNYTVFRSDAGMMEMHRRRLTTLSFGLLQVLSYKFRHPFKPVFYFESLVHPSSYHLFYRYFRRMFPSPKQAMPEQYRELRDACFESFKMSPALSGSADAMHSGWITRGKVDEVEYWQSLRYPDVDFFIKHNPGFPQGDGLLVILPVTFGNLFYCAFMLTKRRFK